MATDTKVIRIKPDSGMVAVGPYRPGNAYRVPAAEADRLIRDHHFEELPAGFAESGTVTPMPAYDRPSQTNPQPAAPATTDSAPVARDDEPEPTK